jgi:hypothetical protein
MTVATVDRETIRRILVEELPRAIEEDADLRYWLIGWMTETFPRRSEVEHSTAQILEQLAALREDFNHQMALQAQRMDAFERRMEELRRDFNRRMEALEQRMEVLEQRIEVLEQRMDAFEQRMEDLRQDFNQRMEDLRRDFNQRMEDLRQDFNRRMEDLRRDFNQQILRLTERHESLEQRVNRGFARLEATLGAIGARWGLMAEESFRSGMAGILRDEFGWQIEHVLMMDTEGYVFGRPDQLEIDIAIHDGAHWLVEIRSSMSKADMYTFVRKVELYERLREVQVARRIVISPMIHPQAREVAERLNIELYTSVYDVSPDLSVRQEKGR